MQRMRGGGTALLILGVFFIVIGVGMLMFDVQIRPAERHWLGPEPSQVSWCVNDRAFSIAIGIGALGLGWCLWFPDAPRRRPRKGRSSHG